MSNVILNNKEVVTVEVVLSKPKFPKYNSGAIKSVEGNWYNVDKDLDITHFRKNGKYEIQVNESDKGYKTIVDVSSLGENKEQVKVSDNKDVRISRQGLFQAALQAPFLVTLFDGKNVDDVLDVVRKLAEEGLKFVNEK